MSAQGLVTRRATGLAGLGVAVLFGAGNALWVFDQPDGGASAEAIGTFYADTLTARSCGSTRARTCLRRPRLGVRSWR